MPLLIPCANDPCLELVDRLGDLCPDCFRRVHPARITVTGETVRDLCEVWLEDGEVVTEPVVIVIIGNK